MKSMYNRASIYCDPIFRVVPFPGRSICQVSFVQPNIILLVIDVY